MSTTCLIITLIMATHTAEKEGKVFINKYRARMDSIVLDYLKIGLTHKWITLNNLTKESSSYVVGTYRFFLNTYNHKGCNLLLFSALIWRTDSPTYVITFRNLS